MTTQTEYRLYDRVEVVGHDREGVVIAVTRKNGNVSSLRVALLNRRGDRVVCDMSPSELEPRT